MTDRRPDEPPPCGARGAVLQRFFGEARRRGAMADDELVIECIDELDEMEHG